MPKKIPVVGIYAMMGAGKSLATQYLSFYTGWQTLSADEVTHQVLRQEDTKRLLQNYFGSTILGMDNEIDRLALGRLVFRSASSRALLERCIWPSIEKRILYEIRGASHGVIIDAAVLIRARWHHFCQRLIYIESKEKHRMHRLLKEKGKTEAQARLIFQMQTDLVKSRVKADYIVTNNGTVSEFKGKIELIAKELLFYFPAKAT